MPAHTVYPCSARLAAEARPSPDLAPVTRTTEPRGGSTVCERAGRLRVAIERASDRLKQSTASHATEHTRRRTLQEDVEAPVGSSSETQVARIVRCFLRVVRWSHALTQRLSRAGAASAGAGACGPARPRRVDMDTACLA